MTDTIDRQRRHNTDTNRARHGPDQLQKPPAWMAGDMHGFWVLLAIVITFTVVAAWVAFLKKR